MNDIVSRAKDGRESMGDGISYAEVVNTRKVIGEHRNLSPGDEASWAMRA
jgi:hypothetical protein